MKKLRKTLSIVLSAIVIIFVIIAVAIGLFANNALGVAIETAATKALNVGVSVSEVDLSILRGALGIDNLVINLMKQGGKLLQAGTGATKAGKSVGEGVIKGAEDVGKGITDGLKGLLKKKEKAD